jgi:hypothetical protein
MSSRTGTVRAFGDWRAVRARDALDNREHIYDWV